MITWKAYTTWREKNYSLHGLLTWCSDHSELIRRQLWGGNGWTCSCGHFLCVNWCCSLQKSSRSHQSLRKVSHLTYPGKSNGDWLCRPSSSSVWPQTRSQPTCAPQVDLSTRYTRHGAFDEPVKAHWRPLLTAAWRRSASAQEVRSVEFMGWY